MNVSQSLPSSQSPLVHISALKESFPRGSIVFFSLLLRTPGVADVR